MGVFNDKISKLRKNIDSTHLSEKQLYKKMYQRTIPVDSEIVLMFIHFCQVVSSSYVEDKNMPKSDEFEFVLTMDASVKTGGALLVSKNTCNKKR